MTINDRLLKCIQAGNAPHAVAVTGPAGSGKAMLARRAAAMYCLGEDAPERLAGFPDYSELAGANVGVEQVRELMARLAVSAFGGGRRAFFIADAHLMRPNSQNALLKTLEEPPDDTLLLLSGNEAGLLPTVRSRCMIWRVGAQDVAFVARDLMAQGVEEQTAELCARASDGVPGVAKMYASPDGMALRQNGAELFRQALFAASPFAGAEALVLEDAAKEGKRRRPDATKLLRLLALWESIARDALVFRCGMRQSCALNDDFLALSRSIAERFTDRQIQGIIEMLGKSMRRVNASGSPALVLDTLLARLSLVGAD